MNKRIFAFMLIVCVCIGTINASTMKAHAATYYTGGLETWAATKIITTLYHLAGVAFDAASEASIWNGGKLDVEQLIKNTETYSYTLAYGLRDLILQGVAGNTTLKINRTWWNEWKEYVREEFGTDATTATILGKVKTNITPNILVAGQKFRTNFAYTPNGGGAFEVSFNTNMYMFLVPVSASNVQYINPYYIVFVPFQKANLADINEIVSNMDFEITYNTYFSVGQPSRSELGSEVGYGVVWNSASGYTIATINNDGNYYQLPNQPTGTTRQAIMQAVAQSVLDIRNGNGLFEETDVSGKPMTGVDGQTATQVGQDVLGLGNTAVQDGDDVVIGGDIPITLPADEVLEDLLKRIAQGTATYEELVETLGAAAVATEDTTAEDVKEKEKTIAISPPTGLYTVSLNNIFPFCIPFDLYDLISALSATPTAPSVTIRLPVSYNGNTFTWEEYQISLEQFDAVAQVVRVFEYILFCTGLMLITRKLIEG